MNDKKIVSYIRDYIIKMISDIENATPFQLTEVEKDNRLRVYNDILKRIDILKKDLGS